MQTYAGGGLDGDVGELAGKQQHLMSLIQHGVAGGIPMYPHVTSRLLTTIDVSSRILTYADVC